MTTLWITFGTFGLVCIGGLLMLLFFNMRQRRQLMAAQKQLESLSSNLAALCAGAVGVDKRVARLERTGRELRVRQENMETQAKPDHAYGDAIRMVRQGATARRLVEECGLSRSEADLIVMLHGLKEAV